MVYAYVHDPGYLRDQRGSGRVDYARIILIAASLGLFQIMLGRGGHDGWFAAPWVRYGAALSALSMVALGTSIDEVRRTEASCDLNRKRRAVAAPPVGNAAITNSAKPAAVDRHRRAADVRAAVDGGRLAGDAEGDDFRFQVCPAPNRPASKDDNVDRTASSPGTYGAESQDSRLFAAFGVFNRYSA
jgi:hypothetical protein